VALDTNLDGQTAVVIGGTTGIGRAIAESLADEGANVVPTSRTEENVREAVHAVDGDLVCPTDVTEREQVNKLFERVSEKVGNLNVLVNSAGVIQSAKPVGEIDDKEWDLVQNTNLYGVFVASQLALDYFDDGPRTILNVSSMNGEIPVEGLTAYGASKYGVRGLTENFALEYADEGVRVNAIAPGYVKTRQNVDALEDDDVKAAIHGRTPLSRYANREEIAAMATVLASPLASFVTGETVVVDGGFSVK
jgi:NAD(P)-dependent dehydrogenase (short-subunit alcohol dehydrogenase family)